MAKSLLFVESEPISPDRVADYHRWHDEVHIPEMLTIEGFVADTFITLYEIDTDIDTARANLRAAFGSGRMSPPEPVRTDPPAVQRYFSVIGS